MGGVPSIQDTRIPVATLVGLHRGGMTVSELLGDFPQLTSDDVLAALNYAAHPRPMDASGTMEE